MLAGLCSLSRVNITTRNPQCTHRRMMDCSRRPLRLLAVDLVGNA